MAEEQPQQKKEEKKAKPQAAQQAAAPEHKPKTQKKEVLTSIIRLSGKDVNGSLPIQRAIDQVKGVGAGMAHCLTFAIETKLKIPSSSTLGSLTEQQVESIEALIKNPGQYGIPTYLLNRRKDMETGKDMHLVSNDLLFATRQDVTRDIAMKSWRGHRHQYGQKVRGQRTRSTGRTGATIGVVKKSEAAKGGAVAASAEGATKEKKEAAPKAAAPTAKPAA